MSYHKDDIPLIRKQYDPLNCRSWPFFVIEMPLTKDGDGPATVGEDADKITYEVWDHLCNTYSSHVYLPSAINEALRLTKELFE